MDKISPIVRDKGDKVPLYVRIYEQLFHLIESNYFKHGEKLPGENALAKELGVSRASLRQALLILQEDGIIHNVQGKGNFLVKTKKNIDLGLERLCSAAKTFNNEDYETVSIDVSYEMPSKWIQSVLQIKSNMLVVVFNRRYKINSEYACYNISVMPYDKITAYNLDMERTEDLLAFLDEEIYNIVTSSKTEIKLTSSGDFVAEKLNIPEENVLILLEETMFEESGEPFILSKSYFRPEFYDFHINRRRYSI
jgi:GntR family transcriptional regulator